MGIIVSRYQASFEQNLKIYYALFKNGALGIEYYGDIGYINSLEKFPQQNNAVFIAFDLPNNAKWEFNTGPGLTNSTDPFVFKTIPGRRINWHAKSHP